MSHAAFYSANADYAAFLAGQDEGFFRKYVAALKPEDLGGAILDVGCGVGQVVGRLAADGFAARGVDICAPAVERAREAGLACDIYNGSSLPFPDSSFSSVGAFNVLEHVAEPVALIREIVRVAQPGGKIVLSSPNFFRVIGFRDYHPHMRGVAAKFRNARRLLAKWREMRTCPDEVAFDRLTPIERTPLQPDDDAITATNSLELAFHLRRLGCRVESVSCVDREISRWLDFALNATPLRYLMFNSFVVARKSRS